MNAIIRVGPSSRADDQGQGWGQSKLGVLEIFCMALKHILSMLKNFCMR